MQILTVAPIVRGVLQESLTYFSKEPIKIGDVVMVPIRTREVPAIVLVSKEASDLKAMLRSSSYALKGIKNVKSRHIWSPSFLKAAVTTAEFSAQKLGETLLSLTPRAILDAHLLGELDGSQREDLKSQNDSLKIRAIEGTTSSRYAEYKLVVREAFARNESIFLCVPTENDVLRASEILGHGIEPYTFSLHSRVTKKCVLEMWRKVEAETHSILVIGTTQYLSIPHTFKTIILDEEHSHSWKMIARPNIDLRIFTEACARAGGSALIIGSPILRAETLARISEGEITRLSRAEMYGQKEAVAILVDPRKEEKLIRENTGRKDMVLITKELKELLRITSEKGESTLLLSARKGLSPITTCGDCGTLVRCPECDTPLVLHKKESSGGTVTNIFICHGCGYTRRPEDNVNETCPSCGGWRLQGVGIGIDKISDEIKRLFPDLKLFVLDNDKAKTRTQAKKIVEQFEKTKGGVLLATPMAIPLLNIVENTAIVSLDALFAIPDIRMPERIVALVLALRKKTSNRLLVQTRADDTSIIGNALDGELLQFTNNELSIRKAFSYPPFGTIIKITLHGKRDEVSSEMERLRAFLIDQSPIVPGTIAREPKNIFRMIMILKLAKNEWPNENLLKKLLALPPRFSIEVNPDHLL